MNFHPFYRNHKEVAKRSKFQSNYSVVVFQDDIYSQDADTIVKVWSRVNNTLGMVKC